MKTAEHDLKNHHNDIFNHFLYEIEREIKDYGLSDSKKIMKDLTDQAKQLGVSAFHIDYDTSILSHGEPSNDDEKFTTTLLRRNKELHITLFQPSIDKQLNLQRKKLIISMGVLFAIFGLVLQWILQKMLAKPFVSMVKTAKAITLGDTKIRFYEKGNDEFGYLGRFINEALDSTLEQQENLKKAIFKEHKSRELAEVTLHSIGDAVITTNKNGIVEYANPTAERLLGQSLAGIRGKYIERILNLVSERTSQPVTNPVIRCIHEETLSFNEEDIILIRKDGQEIDIKESTAPIRDQKGNIIGIVLVFHDVSNTRKMARQLSYQASHDSLTGLYNRHEFETRLVDALRTNHAQGTQHALCYMDLDQFKVVNDSCGHIAGDQLLCQVSDILKKQVRESDTLARLGGDEFGVLLNNCELEQARTIAEKFKDSLSGYRFSWNDNIYEIGISIGVVALSAEKTGGTISDVLTAADIACYAAKDAGRNRIHLFEPGDKDLEKRHGEMRWVSRIHKALDENRFELYYQDIVPTNPDKNILHREFLLRLFDEEGNLVPPMSFIPSAERYNLMTNIDKWVIYNGLTQFKRHQDAGIHYICSINISGQSLTQDDFLHHVVNTISETGVEPSKICFEITETAAIANMADASKFMATLKEMGCLFALDDFGSGLSSFGYLKNMDVDYLKIDGCFVKNMLEDDVDHAMVKSITDVGHLMNLKTIAEFVETQDIMDELKEIGVDYGQGFGLCKPAPLSDLLPYEEDSSLDNSNIA
ncbi:MAG: EAL domain-containing protein [Gammaproteobacteria bacterium]|nr:EAL domain-containing protein [Gammaproteobacteria bacterium]